MRDLAGCDKLVEEYLRWLREGITAIRVDSKTCIIETPFLDQHNDMIQVVVHEMGSGYRLSDDGYTLQDLFASGVEVDSAKRQQVLHTTLARLGVTLDGDEIVVNASPADFALKKHSLVQSILSVSDMLYMSREHVESFFKEDVGKFLKERGFVLSSDVNFLGRAGFYHSFDFIIPSANGSPEFLVRAINNPTKSSITEMLFAWDDTRETRGGGTRAVAVINDQAKALSYEHETALRNYDITPLSWKSREDSVRSLREAA